MMSNGFQGFFATAGGEHFKTMCRQTTLQGTQYFNFIVNNQNSCSTLAHISISSAFPTGNVKLKTAPPPSRFSTQMCPPCASTKPLLTAKPNPEPVIRADLFCVPSTR